MTIKNSKNIKIKYISEPSIYLVPSIEKINEVTKTYLSMYT